jgi:hypothetical protein
LLSIIRLWNKYILRHKLIYIENWILIYNKMLASLISTVFLFAVCYLLLKIYLEPLYKMHLITSQHPKFMSVFVPLMGEFKLYRQSQIEYASHVHWVYKLRQKNQGMRVYVTNVMNTTVVNLSCPKLVKNFVNNQNNFKK